MKSYFKSVPFFITLGVLLFVGIASYMFAKKYALAHENPGEVKILKTYNLPRVLEEISGISYLENHKIACVQDEKGIIFIYNLNNSKITREITFAKNGDYEGITLVGKTAYVVKSNGQLYEIENIADSVAKVKRYKTALTSKYDVEGLCYDKANHRLLLACKESGNKNNQYKPVFAFDLVTKKLQETPVFKIAYTADYFKNLKHFGKAKVFKPSAIGIHPVTREVYILDGVRPKLLILSKAWEFKALYHLDTDDFPQPEGITFSPEGTLFISNEGEWNPANIHQLVLIPNQ
ncbi:MAG: SdiA-regulated domain-containing protein [Mesonia hippocampi]|uniref:SdiA-regulated domain-containing protein n=1 Tax=Mesonia hippocampi TaxID=1628250 RepID=UPI003F974636